MNCKLLTVCSDPNYAQPLLQSAAKHGWPTECLVTPWQGFGTKLLTVREYLLDNPDVSHFFFADAYDVVVLGGMEEALSKLDTSVITCSAERGCWPRGEWEKFYTNIYPHGFNYLNSGLYFAPRELLLSLMERFPPEYATDDQEWFTEKYLFEDHSMIVLDNEQAVFNSHSFILDGEYTYFTKRKRIGVNGELPILVHFNGRTVDEKFEDMMR